MTRRLLNFLTALSLLFCVAAAGLWVRSFWASDQISFAQERNAAGRIGQHVHVWTTRGWVVWQWTWEPGWEGVTTRWRTRYTSNPNPHVRSGRSTLDRLGVGIVSGSAGDWARGWRDGALGLWIIVPLLALPPAWRWALPAALRRYPCERWRMTRPALASLLLAVAVLLLWTASTWVELAVQWRRHAPASDTYITHAITARGDLLIVSRSHPVGPGAHDPYTGLRIVSRNLGRYEDTTFPPSQWRGAAGFHATRPHDPQASGGKYRHAYSAATIPLWLPALGLLLLPAASIRRSWTRDQRTRQGRCRNCGYDLSGSSARCPECGSARDVGSKHVQSSPAS